LLSRVRVPTTDFIYLFISIAEFSCSRCKNKSLAQQQLFLSKAPPVLVVQLKRFYYDNPTKKTVKLPHFVEFPSQFDLSDYVLTNPLDEVRINFDFLFSCKFCALIH
jgi:uncharacterized UBP type Zn finger protein